MARPRRFDEQLLLECAQEQFWSKGYDSTSIENIAATSGIGNGSIYAAYGSKLGLFLAVFTRYCQGQIDLVGRIVGEHEGDFESAVAYYLDGIILDCTSHEDRRGCLMLNSLAELGSRFPEVVVVGRETISAMERILSDRVAQSVDSGEISLAVDDIEPLGAHILLVSQGLIQLSKIGTPPERLRSIASTSSRMSSLLAA